MLCVLKAVCSSDMFRLVCSSTDYGIIRKLYYLRGGNTPIAVHWDDPAALFIVLNFLPILLQYAKLKCCAQQA